MVNVRFWRKTIEGLASDVELLDGLTEDYFQDLNRVKDEFEEEKLDEEFLEYTSIIIQRIIGNCENLL